MNSLTSFWESVTRPVPGSVLDQLPPDSRIAVVRPGRLGDMVVLTPALRALRQAAPRARITLLCQRAGKLLEDRLPWVDEVAEIRDHSDDLDSQSGDGRVRAFFAEMRRRYFHVALQCAGGGERMNSFVQALGADVTAGQASPDAPSLDLCMPPQRPYQAETLRLMDIVGLIGVPAGDPRPEIVRLPRDAGELAQVAGLEPAVLEQPGVIAVHVGSGSGSRRWAPERYARLLDHVLQAEPFQAVLVGTEEETAIATEVRCQMRQQHRVHDVTGRLTLGALIDLLARVRLFVGNDSGPAHLAAGLGAPAVIIYGSGHPGTWAPASHLWQRPVACLNAPCRLIGQKCGCPDDSSAVCIAGVSVEAVQREVFSLLRLVHASSATQENCLPA